MIYDKYFKVVESEEREEELTTEIMEGIRILEQQMGYLEKAISDLKMEFLILKRERKGRDLNET